MFILKKEATFTYPIVYFQPADGGGQVKQTFDAIFKILPQSRINELSLLVEKKKKDIVEGLLSENQNTKKPLQADDLKELFKPLENDRNSQN